jgi:small subunit ribosomal protein S1
METGVLEASQTEEFKPKMKFSGKVVKISLAGAAVEIGEGKHAVLHISQMLPNSETESIRRVEDVLQIGQVVDVWVRRVREGRIELTMIEPLALDWRDIKKDMVVKGTVVRLEKFGAFVEIGAERPGLIHISEMAHGYVKTPGDVVKEGDEIDTMVLEVNRKKKQIKLSMKALLPEPVVEETPKPRTPSADEFQQYQAKEKPARRNKKPRKSKDYDDAELLNLEGQAEAEPEPTYMEIAIREAMDKAKVRKAAAVERARKEKAISREQDDLLTRTLENKVKTS